MNIRLTLCALLVGIGRDAVLKGFGALKLVRALLLVLALAVPDHAFAQAASTEVIPLWPGNPPGRGGPSGPETIGDSGAGEGAVSNVSVARMEVYRPARPNGAAVLVIGGGGYFRIQIASAARPIARWLQSQGVTAFVLYYRLPADGWNADAPFQDGQRAMRLIRSRAAMLGVDPRRLGVLGSSAGAHLAAILATRGDHDFYSQTDSADAFAARPDFAGLLYPVVSLQPPLDTTRTARQLRLLPHAAANFSAELHVTAATPPIFLAHAADDPIANVGHSLAMFTAMHAAGRPVELHVFGDGGHSWGMGARGSPVAAWPALFATWMRGLGIVDNGDWRAR
jgi:acetyl esterase/lipase